MLSAPLLIPFLIVVTASLAVFFSVRRLRRLRSLPIGKFRRITERVTLSLVTLVVVVAAASTTFNVIAHDVFAAHHPAPGQIYVVNGYKMHLWCTGEGSPTIILEAGAGDDSLVWGKVKPGLSKTTRVCSYDRAGTGWSEPQPGPRDSDHIVEQLHGLLQAADITGPIILMGHSIAGMHMRGYVTRYPQNVQGIVFVDGSTPMQQDHFPQELRAKMPRLIWTEILLGGAALELGVLRVAGQCHAGTGPEDWEVGDLQGENGCSVNLPAATGEYMAFEQDGVETIHTGPYGDLPILIFSQDPANTVDKNMSQSLSPQAFAEMNATWNQMQEDLKKLSTRSRRIIAKGSGHYVELYRSDLLLKEVPPFIELVRGNAPPPQYGTTTTE
jgi:pimeloyl-ACP methyl ester carboxylesterase